MASHDQGHCAQICLACNILKSLSGNVQLLQLNVLYFYCLEMCSFRNFMANSKLFIYLETSCCWGWHFSVYLLCGQETCPAQINVRSLNIKNPSTKCNSLPSVQQLYLFFWKATNNIQKKQGCNKIPVLLLYVTKWIKT